MDARMNALPSDSGRPDAAGLSRIADTLDRERRFEQLGSGLSTIRIFLLLSVQCYLLLGFALIFVRPPSGSFYIAIIVLAINSLLFAGALLRFFIVRKQMLRLTGNP
ncbi:MAG: hypothetical protein WCN95_10235 [bacterium]